MKNFLFTLLLLAALLCAGTLNAQEQISLLSMGLAHNTARGALLSNFFDTHFANILNTIDSFQQLDDPALRSQIASETDASDSFLLQFSRRAAIPIVVRGSITDRGEYLILRIYAFSHDLPFNGSLIANHEVSIPVIDQTSSRELSYIMEEHTGRFLQKLLKNYRHPVHFSVSGTRTSLKRVLPDKEYPTYRILGNEESISTYEEAGTVTVINGSISHNLQSGEYFLLTDYTESAAFLDDFFYGRKREIVFQKTSVEQKAATILASPFLSIIAPIGAPVSYYLTSDFDGMGLWALNNSPYLGIASYGFLNPPDKLKEKEKDITRFDRASYSFSYYYFLAGGMSMYADAVGHTANVEASNYVPAMPFTGDPFIAVYLSLMGSGAGHFYKGYRNWGYFYFHTDNLLLFSSLYFLSEEENYNGSSYSTTEGNRTAGFSFLAAAAVVRIIEIFHCTTMKFNINNGKDIDHRVETIPEFKPDSSGGLFFGLSARKRL